MTNSQIPNSGGQSSGGQPGQSSSPGFQAPQQGEVTFPGTCPTGSGESAAGHSSAKQEAKAAWDETKQEAKQATESAKAKAASMAGDAKAAAVDAAERAKQQGRDYVHRQKDQAAEELTHFESAIRRASEKLREEHDDHVACYADAAAEQVGALAGYLRNHDVGGLMRDVENMARRKPEMFLGGMFVAGLAAARFLKASSRPSQPPRTEPAPWPEPRGAGTTAGSSMANPSRTYSTDDVPVTTAYPQKAF